MRFHTLFVPRARQLTFAADITIHSLENVPMLSGLYYAKLKLPSHATPTPVPAPITSDFPSLAPTSTQDSPLRSATTVTTSPASNHSANSPSHHPHHGSHTSLASQIHQRHATSNSNTSTTSSSSSSNTSNPSAPGPAPPSSSSSPRIPLRDHSVTWHWRYCFDAAMVKDDLGVLESWPFLLVIKLDRSEELKTLGPGAGSQATERIGVLHLDLAHFAGPKSVTTRKFLLQETRVNSTVKVTIAMTLKSGDPLFKVPELPSDMQIDLSRFTKSLNPGGHTSAGNNAHFDTSVPDADCSSVIRSGSVSDNSSLHSSRIASAAHRAATAPLAPFSHASSSSASSNPPSSLLLHDLGAAHHAPDTLHLLPSSSSGLSGHSGAAGVFGLAGASAGSQLLVTSPASDTAISPSSLHLAGALPHLPHADPRPSAAIVDDLFSQVLATAKVSHHLTASPPGKPHSRRVSGASASVGTAGSFSGGATNLGQVTAIYVGGGGGGGGPVDALGAGHARASSAGSASKLGGSAVGAGLGSAAFRPAMG